MKKDKIELIESVKDFSNKNKLFHILSIIYVTTYFFVLNLLKYFKLQLIRILLLAALIAAFILITSFNPNVFEPETNIENIVQEEIIEEDNGVKSLDTANLSVDDFDIDSWNLILINKQHKIPVNYSIELETINGSMKADSRIITPLKEMFDAAKSDGVNLYVCSPYRDDARQVFLFNRKAKNYLRAGESFLDAFKRAAKEVTVPGTSEHEAGISLDILGDGYSKLDKNFGKSKAGIWLYENSYKYGFILRYPQGKEDVTGIIYEPWHYRYVGCEAATYIKEHELTLEEFIEGLK